MAWQGSRCNRREEGRWVVVCVGRVMHVDLVTTWIHLDPFIHSFISSIHPHLFLVFPSSSSYLILFSFPPSRRVTPHSASPTASTASPRFPTSPQFNTAYPLASLCRSPYHVHNHSRLPHPPHLPTMTDQGYASSGSGSGRVSGSEAGDRNAYVCHQGRLFGRWSVARSHTRSYASAALPASPSARHALEWC